MQERLRTRLLPYNPYFRAALTEARESLGLTTPLPNEEAVEWRDHLAKQWADRVREQEVEALKASGVIAWPPRGLASGEEVRRALIPEEYDPELRYQMIANPLFRNAFALAKAFGLPMARSLGMLSVVELAILTSEPALLAGLAGPYLSHVSADGAD